LGLLGFLVGVAENVELEALTGAVQEAVAVEVDVAAVNIP